MTFPLYGDSYGQLAGQQQSYDQFFNGINQANRAALTEANNRNLEMAFRSRDIRAQDARALANQDEEARRFALALANQAQDRADQISQARAASEYQNMAFKARQANDAALLQLERDKLAAMQSGKTDHEEQALMLSEHLGQLKEAADAAAAKAESHLNRIESIKAQAERNGYKLAPDKAGKLVFTYGRQEPLPPTAPGKPTFAEQLNGALVEEMNLNKAAQTAALRAKQQFEKNLWNAKQFGLKQGMTISDEGITTRGGSQYRFAPQGSATASAPTPITAQVRWTQDASGNLTPVYQGGGEHGSAVSDAFGPSSSTPQFTPPPTTPPAATPAMTIPAGSQSEGFIPSTISAAKTGAGYLGKAGTGILQGFTWGVDRLLPSDLPEAKQTGVEFLRGAKDFFIRPTPGTAADRYMRAIREQQDYRTFQPPQIPDRSASQEPDYGPVF